MYAAIRQAVERHRPIGPEVPRSKPRYISPKCPVPGCDKDLVLDDELDGIPENRRWWDEWTCVIHRDIHIDHPTEQVARA